MASQLQTIMDRLLATWKVDFGKLESIFERVARLETVVNKKKTELDTLKAKTKVIEEGDGEIEKGMEFANSQIEELKKKDQENAAKIKELKDQLLYKEVYSRRENLRFFGIPETTD